MPSIARRIWLTYFLLSVCLIGVMVSIVVYVKETMEETLRESTFEEERDFFLAQQTRNGGAEPVLLESPTLTAYFVPKTANGGASPPVLFDGLPADFFGQIRRGQSWYLVDIDRLDGGTFYFARDITSHERQEALFTGILAAASGVILGLSFLLSVLAGRRLTIPLRRLAGHIRDTPAGQRMPRLPVDYRDRELAAIAGTFNCFLDELEAFVKREHSLVSLASHELRTPIAVISGALDVMEKRGHLGEDDQTTLRRIRDAAAEMEENVKVLLRLSRRQDLEEQGREMPLRPLVLETVQQLAVHFDVAKRVHVEIPGAATVMAQPALARMLLRNLINNALEHTDREVWVRSRPDRLEIVDEGAGLTEEQRQLLAGNHKGLTGFFALNGLGLYIATLVCERLGWRLQVDRGAAGGTAIHVLF